MNSVENVSKHSGLQQNWSEESTQDLKYIICCQKTQIEELKRKLEIYNEVITDRDNLRKLVNELEQQKEINYVSHKVFTEILTSFEDQTEKLRKVATVECNWQTKYDELQNVNDCITDQLNVLNSNESILKFNFEDSEKKLKYVQKEMDHIKAELEEANGMIRKLKTNMKSNEEELCKKRRQFDECTNKCNRLIETNMILEKDIKCTQLKLVDTRCATRAEEKWKFEIETLSNELKIKCIKLKDLELQYNRVNCEINDDKYKVKTLVTTLKDLKEASLQKYSEMKNEVLKLKEENGRKNTDICCLKNNIKQLQRENEFNNIQINTLKNKQHRKNCQLKEFKLLSQNIVKLETSACLEQPKSTSSICTSPTSDSLTHVAILP